MTKIIKDKPAKRRPSKTFSRRSCAHCKHAFQPAGSRETLCPWCKAVGALGVALDFLRKAVESR